MSADTTLDAHEPHEDIIYPSAIPFVLAHLACLGAIWSGVTVEAVVIGVGLYVVRMFGITAGFHRYFSHRSYDAGRIVRFLLAFLAETSAQQGVLWWAAKHREHHKHSDTPEDVHSPRHSGFWFAHVGWIFHREKGEADYSMVKDLRKYPELVWLDRLKYLPAILLAAGVWLAAGWPGLFVGFFWSTALTYHGTFAINSLAHTFGKQRYLTGDDSRNSLLLAIITLGEGWHNNHHYYQSATRQGFRWWEIDPTYYALKVLSWIGVVDGLREPPEEVVRGERRIGRRTLEKVARELAESFPVEGIADRVAGAWSRRPDFRARVEEAHRRLSEAGHRAESALAEVELPHLPTSDEVRSRAREMFVHTPSLDAIVTRARAHLAEAVCVRLLDDREPLASAG